MSALPATTPAAPAAFRGIGAHCLPLVLRRLPSVLLVVVACALVFLGLAAPASAHDDLASSSPQDGATVETAPTELVLTFTNTPSGIGADVTITDTAGTEWSDGAVSVINNTAVQALKPGTPAGTYTVQWRVVSSDSHPIEGTLTFTSTTAQETPADTGVTNPAQEPDQQSTTAPPDSADSTDSAPSLEQDSVETSSGLPGFVLYLVIGGVLAVIALILFTRRNLGNK